MNPIDKTLKKGPHKSAEEYAQFLRKELLDFVKKRFCLDYPAMVQKLLKVKNRRYFGEGLVSALPSFFAVPKGTLLDIQIVYYDGTVMRLDLTTLSGLPGSHYRTYGRISHI